MELASQHLKTHGFDVSVYDVNDEQLAKAAEAGGIQTNSPREVGENSDYVIVGVGTSRKCTPA